MSNELSGYVRGATYWRLWNNWATSAEDSLLADLKPSERPTSRLIPGNDATCVALIAFGKTAENETATVQISGWCENGPGKILWKGTITLGSITYSENPLAPHTFGDHKRFGDFDSLDTGPWFEVDTWTQTSNASSAAAFSGSNQSMLIVPTFGYANLYIEAGDKNNAGSEIGDLAILWRPYNVQITV